MQVRTVNDTLLRADGAPAANKPVIFVLDTTSAAPTALITSDTISVTTDTTGAFSVSLWCSAEGAPPVLWMVTLPDGTTHRFSLSAGTGSVTLRSLLAQRPLDEHSAPTAETRWEQLKRAAVLYSRYRPRLIYDFFAPTVGTKAQPIPAGAFGVESIDYGVELTYAEVMTGSSANVGWCFTGGALYLNPAPVDASPINIVWRCAHLPDESARVFPTIPPEDTEALALLADAEAAEAAQTAQSGVVASYTIGNTTVNFNAGADRLQASQLRRRALARLDDSIGFWG